MTMCQRHSSVVVEFKHAQVGNDFSRSIAGQTQCMALLAAGQESGTGNEIDFRGKTLTILRCQNHGPPGMNGNLACSSASRQSHFARIVRADYGGIDVAELVD